MQTTLQLEEQSGPRWDQALVRNLRVLNLFAGLGGNRKLWENVEVTAVEMDPRIAAVYQRLHPQDTVIVGDAHAYLLENFANFDFVWTSPPCQTHSKMARATRHALKRYPDMMLYQEIIFLRHYFTGPWIVENVTPYYEPLIPAQKVGRHLFWSNFDVRALEIPNPPNFINKCNLAGKQAMMDWLGIHYPENIYYGKNHCPAQILRNCVHPKVGAQVLESVRQHLANDQGDGRREPAPPRQ
jgi:DNA (cytosine-5)-methyltransferase 1